MPDLTEGDAFVDSVQDDESKLDMEKVTEEAKAAEGEFVDFSSR